MIEIDFASLLLFLGVFLVGFLLGLFVGRKVKVVPKTLTALGDLGYTLAVSLRDGKLSEEERASIVEKIVAIFQSFKSEESEVYPPVSDSSSSGSGSENSKE